MVLTAVEVLDLTRLETQIEQGLQTFVEVGEALLRIRDARLYRATHETFERYCRERWDMTARHANRTIEAAEVAAILGPIGPANEAQARELAPLRDDPEAMAEVLQLAGKNGRPTAASIRAVMGTKADAIENPFERRALRAFTELLGVLHGVQATHEIGDVVGQAGAEDRRRFIETLPSVIEYLRNILAELKRRGVEIVK